MDEPLKGSKDYQKPENNKHTNYLEVGSIHGLKYLGRKQKCETIFFAAITLISLTLATIFIWFLSQSATIAQPQPIHNLPFAAITICPETKAKKSLINFTDLFTVFHSNEKEKNVTDKETSYLEALTQVCDPHLFEKFNLSENPTSGEKFTDILREIATENYALFCKFRNQLDSCENHFKETITDSGLCKTFNMIPTEEMFTGGNKKSSWSPQNGYNNESFDAYPHRAFRGAFVGFNVVLNQASNDLDFICSGPVQGWKVKIHSPNEFPSMSSGFERIPLNSETTISVKPEVTLASGSSCHSTASNELKYFKEYSQENCMNECLSSFVLSNCNCVKFSMIHGEETPICNQHQTQCFSDATDKFFTINRFNDKFSCDCKPSCTTVKYTTKAYQAAFDFKATFKSYQEDLEGEFSSSSMSRLTVYMEDDFYVPKVNDSTSDSVTDVIAKIGGILAFFLGASWISIIEVFYHLFRRFTSLNSSK